ncbi:MAG: hypothetical protein E6Y85_00340 [Peptoniphilus harei]|nr:hypothetical protein [Peptoniphilus harei]
MNREYILIGIATGRTSAEANNIVLTPEERKRVDRYKAKAEKEKEKIEALYFMYLMRIDYNKIKEKNYFKRTPDISLGFSHVVLRFNFLLSTCPFQNPIHRLCLRT